MLKVRVLSGAAMLILLAVVMLLPKEVLAVAVFIISFIGLYEFYSAVSSAGYKPIRVLGYLACISSLFIGFSRVLDKNNTFPLALFTFGIFVIIFIACIFIVFFHHRYNINDLGITFFGIFYVVFLFAFLILTRYLADGEYFIWLIFIGAWVTDTFAYFTGKALGKKKLLPAISPKKTVEGSIGGIAGCVAVTAIYGVLISKYVNYMPLYHYIMIGILSGIVSQIGDLSASAIKRHTGIKDYGNIVPGHGGILDRFDSILFIAPMVYFYISFLIIR